MSEHDELVRPSEFAFMPPDEWNDFNAELRDIASELHLDVERFAPGAIVLPGGRLLQLVELAKLCHHYGRERWRHYMSNHLTSIRAHAVREPDPFSILDLRVRLVPDERSDHDVLKALGARPFAEGIVQILSVRLNDKVRPVPTSELDELGWDVETAWASAWAQTRTLERPDEINSLDADGALIHHMFAEHYFAASFVPFIGDMIELPEHGALVSMPVRHSVLVHPVRDRSAITALRALIPITRQLHRTGPGAVSPHLYWWRDRELIWMPTWFGEDRAECFAPEEFSLLMNEFPSPGD